MSTKVTKEILIELEFEYEEEFRLFWYPKRVEGSLVIYENQISKYTLNELVKLMVKEQLGIYEGNFRSHIADFFRETNEN